MLGATRKAKFADKHARGLVSRNTEARRVENTVPLSTTIDYYAQARPFP